MMRPAHTDPERHPIPRCATTRVDLWLRRVDGTPDERVSWLDDGERNRARRFRYDRDRARFLNRRVYLREVLARYLRQDPAGIHLTTDGRGRLRLVGQDAPGFNTSHSHGLAAVAVSGGRVVGVDIERLRPIDDALALARGLFCASELASLGALPEPQRSDAFLTLWTRKESVAKATGFGLSLPLDGFDVLATVDGVGRPAGPGGTLPYVYADFGAPGAYAGAVALGDTGAQPIVSLRIAV